jgi:enolase
MGVSRVDTSIRNVTARRILDCRGYPTVQVDVWVGDVLGRADVPAGRSTGRHEAVELRDGGTAYGGQDVSMVLHNVAESIAPQVVGLDVSDQVGLDRFLCELDGTSDKRSLGANAVLGVSLAAARCAAKLAGLPLHRYLRADSRVLPVPLVNLINGGRLTSNDLDFQEFIAMPVGASSFSEAMRMASECHMALYDVVVSRYGKLAGNTGDEGGYATPITDVREALDVLREGVRAAGYEDEMVYALDCAATHLWDPESQTYTVGGARYDTAGMIELYRELVRDYGIASIEDPLAEEDWDGWAAITDELGGEIQLVGDDLFVTNPGRVRHGIERGAANALLWKVNQIGTLTEALEAAETAYRAGYGVCVSERSGETEDPIIADLVVALNAGQIKTGSPVRGERTAKYNRLFQIEEWLGSDAVYGGRAFRNPTLRASRPAGEG